MANNVSGDVNCKAQWNLDSGALTTDSKGTNTLTNVNSVAEDLVDYIQGDCSGDFDGTNNLEIADADLDFLMPLRSGSGNNVISIFCRFIRGRTGTEENLVSKYDTNSKRSFRLAIGSGDNLFLAIGYNSGASVEVLSGSYTTVSGRWYSVLATYNGATRAWTLFLYDHTANSIVENTGGTGAQTIFLSTADFTIGAEASAGTPRRFQGNIDEVLIFNDIVSDADACKLIGQSYGAAGNDFSGDPRYVAHWKFDNGALTTDSAGGNTLTNNNAVINNTVDFDEGDASADFEESSSQYFSIADSSLDSGFPLKSGESNLTLTAVGSFILESLPSAAGYNLIAKHNPGTDKRCLSVSVYEDTGTYYIRIGFGYNGGASFEGINVAFSSIEVGRLYRWAFTYDDSTKAYTIRVLDVITDLDIVSGSGNVSNNISVTDAPFTIGAYLNTAVVTWAYDGEQDSIVIFDEVLGSDEIDDILEQIYDYITTASPTTIVTTLSPTTSVPTTITTTLAPTTITTTLSPTTPAPTTSGPTTLAPTTIVTTLAPTTLPDLSEEELNSIANEEDELNSTIREELELNAYIPG